MMPPKKSKAARAGAKCEEEAVKETPPAEENGDSDDKAAAEKEEEVANHKNIFQETVVEGKRKRTVPPVEAKLNDWFSQHLEDKEGVLYNLSLIHSAFVEECIADGVPGLEDIFFRKRLHDRFPKGFAIKEESAYSKEIKARKKITKTKVQGDTFKLKPKEVLERTFKDLGNPVGGLTFRTVRQYITAKYPALRVDLKPHYVTIALNNGVHWGYIELLRGIKKSGVYRLYVDGRDVDAELEKEREKKSQKKEKKPLKEGDGDESKSEDDKSQGDVGKDKDAGKDKDEDDEGSGEAADGEKEGEEQKKKKRSKPAVPKSRRGQIRHGQPERVEDCFPLALTFGTEPKRCSTRKMSEYIKRHYPDVNVEQRLKPCLERGQEKGFWEHVSTSMYQLTVDEFDPTDDDDMIGKVVNAIMACTEPKQCSAGLLKNYVVEFHPQFGVGDHSSKFKKALVRAENCGDLIRLSGIGGSGSFQLAYQFQPAPVILAAQDTDSDYVDSDDDDNEVSGSVRGKGVSAKDVDIEAYQDAYKPRPSQRRGKARQSAGNSFFQRQMQFAAEMTKPQRVPAPTASTNKRRRTTTAKRALLTDSEDSEEEQISSDDHDDEVYRIEGRLTKKEKKQQAAMDVYKSDELYKPRPTASRKGRAPSPPPPPAKKKPIVSKSGKKSATSPAAKSKKPATKAAPARGKRTPTKAALKARPKAPEVVEEEQEEEKEEEQVEVEDVKPVVKGRGRKAVSAPKYVDVSEESADEAPPPAKKKATTPAARGRVKKVEEEEATTPPKRTPRQSPAISKYTELAAEEEDDAPSPAKKAKKAGKGGRRRR